jgi:hypothetical protein
VEIAVEPSQTTRARKIAWQLLTELGIPIHLPRNEMRQQGKLVRKQRAQIIRAAMLEGKRRAAAEAEERRQTKQAAERQCVYVISSPGQPVKIGIAEDVRDRLQSLQVGFPWKLRVYFHVEAFGGLARKVERQCHALLADYRLSGEWFDYDPYAAAELVQEVLSKLKVA